jgi:hypothetical protein
MRYQPLNGDFAFEKLDARNFEEPFGLRRRRDWTNSLTPKKREPPPLRELPGIMISKRWVATTTFRLTTWRRRGPVSSSDADSPRLQQASSRLHGLLVTLSQVRGGSAL